MQRHVLDPNDRCVVRLDDAEPVCGRDFCDLCGECLACFGWDRCYAEDGDGAHQWTVDVAAVEE